MAVWDRVSELVGEGVAAGWCATGRAPSKAALAAAEKAVGRFPDEYRRFVATFGWLEGDVDVCGVGAGVEDDLSVVVVTGWERETDVPFDPRLLVVATVGNGDCWCVRSVEGADDVSEVWYVDHERPGRVEPIGQSFLEWLVGALEEAAEAAVPKLGWASLPDRVEEGREFGVRFGEGVFEAEIVAAESVLGAFPPAYREFLRTCGWLWESESMMVAGLGDPFDAGVDLIELNRRQREEISPALPDDLIAVHESRWGSVYCVEVASDGGPFDPPVVKVNREFYPDEIRREVYDNLIEMIERYIWSAS